MFDTSSYVVLCSVIQDKARGVLGQGHGRDADITIVSHHAIHEAVAIESQTFYSSPLDPPQMGFYPLVGISFPSVSESQRKHCIVMSGSLMAAIPMEIALCMLHHSAGQGVSLTCRHKPSWIPHRLLYTLTKTEGEIR